ncbi:MAG: hypothetical protein ACI35R_09880 [Bacillus sp. (in: firmicutes)]
MIKEYNAINPDQPALDDYGHGTNNSFQR